jgi:Flp pilus assembly protein TadG
MVFLFAMVAFAVDVGYLVLVRTQAQRTADAAALAGAASLYEPIASLENYAYYLPPDPDTARTEARRFVRHNLTAGKTVDVDLNVWNEPSGDILVGRLYNAVDQTEPMDFFFPNPNTVQVSVRLTQNHKNGPVTLFFARPLGFSTAESGADATAMIWYPSVLPFATSVDNWERLLRGETADSLAREPGQGSFGITSGQDGIPELEMFPGPWDNGDLPPGNFGVLQIGSQGEVLEILRRQIDMGPTEDDLAYHGGGLESGEKVPGRTGIKSSTKHAFLGGWADGRTFGGMLGRPRQLPIYESAEGNGENAVFTLSRFVAVHVMALKIGGRWRTQYRDTEGDEIEAVKVQPLRSTDQLIQVQLVR